MYTYIFKKGCFPSVRFVFYICIHRRWYVCEGGACISVYNPKGKKIHKIDLDAKNITNCTFGGLQNNEIFVSTALKGMNKSEIKKYKHSGSLFKIKTNVKGIQPKPFKI